MCTSESETAMSDSETFVSVNFRMVLLILEQQRGPKAITPDNFYSDRLKKQNQTTKQTKTNLFESNIFTVIEHIKRFILIERSYSNRTKGIFLNG